jgi:hypothetical protein
VTKPKNGNAKSFRVAEKMCAMSASRQKCKVTIVRRLMRAARAEGLAIKRVTTDAAGLPVLITDKDEAASEQQNPLDRILNALNENGTS